MSFEVDTTLQLARALREGVRARNPPPEEGGPSAEQGVVYLSLVSGTRGYLEKVVHQINGSYSQAWYDACAVMIRRLIETLIIECYEAHNIADKIKGPDGDFLFLRDLVGLVLAEGSWNLGRTARKALPKLKDVGDRSAHSRRYTAHRRDIDDLRDDLRQVVQELVSLAGLK